MHLNRRELVLGGFSCCASGVAFAAPSDRAFRRAHRAATRKMVIYRGLETLLLARITYLSGGFRDAMAAHLATQTGATREELDAFRERMAADRSEFHEVVFAADTGLDRPNKFGPGDDRWNLHLDVRGAEQELVESYHVRKPTLLHQAMYLQLNVWSDLWIARFRKSQAGNVRLRLASALGNGTVMWEGRDAA